MFLAWDGIATVVKAVSAVMIAEVLLAFFSSRLFGDVHHTTYNNYKYIAHVAWKF